MQRFKEFLKEAQKTISSKFEIGDNVKLNYIMSVPVSLETLLDGGKIIRFEKGTLTKPVYVIVKDKQGKEVSVPEEDLELIES
jgi:hypothetical protein